MNSVVICCCCCSKTDIINEKKHSIVENAIPNGTADAKIVDTESSHSDDDILVNEPSPYLEKFNEYKNHIEEIKKDQNLNPLLKFVARELNECKVPSPSVVNFSQQYHVKDNLEDITIEYTDVYQIMNKIEVIVNIPYFQLEQYPCILYGDNNYDIYYNFKQEANLILQSDKSKDEKRKNIKETIRKYRNAFQTHLSNSIDIFEPQNYYLKAAKNYLENEIKSQIEDMKTRIINFVLAKVNPNENEIEVINNMVRYKIDDILQPINETIGQKIKSLEDFINIHSNYFISSYREYNLELVFAAARALCPK